MTKKQLPKGVPEENTYNSTHFLVYLFYIIAVVSVVWLLVNQS